MKKLAYTVVLTAMIFVAAFAASFLTMGVALAQPAPTEEPEPTPTETAPAETPGAPGEVSKETPALTDEDAAKMGLANEAAGDDIRKDGHGKSPTQGDDHGAAHHDPSKHFNYLGAPFEHLGKDQYGGKYGDGKMVDPHTGEVVVGEEPMSAPFIYMILNFALLLGLLAWKGGPVARKAAVERHDQIKTALEEAAKLRQQAAAKLAEYETRLKDADSEIKKLVEGMRADAEADKQRILENAERQATQMKKDSELRIAAEIELARVNLTREVTAAATKATEKLLREKMMPGDQQKLVSTFISDIQGANRKEAR
ncbi:MAG: ATP synthase F0 subunit B [Deltaproteobacteria bacterium]|nr:ATP synthase F0 subunit B [Deltaproteobacteria bacterium]MDQ3299881.1 ATP synthase F0 subunit B [Myxococcota bacterium]